MLTITLLGTAATMPLPDRALTAALAECGGHALLFDCGEGTQAAARRAGVNLMKLDAICLTHYHGDHIFGLPGLLQTLGCQGRERPLTLYGPEGLGEIWPALRTLAGPLLYPVRAVQLDNAHRGAQYRQHAFQRGEKAGHKHDFRRCGRQKDLPAAHGSWGEDRAAQGTVRSGDSGGEDFRIKIFSEVI